MSVTGRLLTESELRIRVVKYTYTQGSPVEIKNPHTLKPDLPQHDHTAVCVIAQQYSSTTYIPLPFYSHKESFGAPSKNI
jgi:hypothetical protein